MPSHSEAKRHLATTDDAPVKRFRVSRACDQCRAAREKCDGVQPVCFTCANSKRDCAYTSNPRKRGLQPGFIRSLEVTLAFIFQKNPDIEVLVNNQLNQVNSALLAKGGKESAQLHKSWRKSKFCKGINKALAGGQISFNDDKAHSSDADSDVDVDVDDTKSVQESTSLQAFAPPQEEAPIGSFSRPMSHQHNLSVSHPSLSTQLTVLPSECWKFLDLYSLYAQTWLPMSEKLDVLKLFYSYPERGLHLSPDMINAGHHAEMWSILAVGCLQDLCITARSQDEFHVAASERLYSIARSLIPDEVGNLDLGHIKALLNLALFNIRRSKMKAAFLLVSVASKIFLTLDKSQDITNTRRRNVLASCFFLDNLLALHFEQRPCLYKSDLLLEGSIVEDGLDEWSPWAGEVDAGPIAQSRLPTLALSSFNGVLNLVDILISTAQPTPKNFVHEMIGRLEVWKDSLPPKLDYIRSDSTPTPLTPPAVLLQLTYLSTAFALVPSHTWLQRILEFLEILQTQFGFSRTPPIVTVLLKSIQRSCSNLSLTNAMEMRLRTFLACFTQACSITSVTSLAHTRSISNAAFENSPEFIQVHNSDMIQHSPQSFVSYAIQQQIPSQCRQPTGTSSLLDDLLPDMNQNRPNTASAQSVDLRAFEMAADTSTYEVSVFDPQDPFNAFAAGDLDSFLDELASLHGAKKSQNQSQFMQNLGFPSEASMNDLFSVDTNSFAPLPASDIGKVNDNDISNFPLHNLYDAR